MTASEISVRIASETSETSEMTGTFAHCQASETSELSLDIRTDGRCKPDAAVSDGRCGVVE